RDLARGVEAGELQHLVDVCLAGTIEHWRSHRHTYAKLLAQCVELLVRQFADAVSLPVDLLNGLFETIQLAALAVLLQRLIDDAPVSAAGPAEMRLEDLPDVHARGHAEGVQHHVDGCAVLEERHVLDGHDHRHDALVAVAASHLVAGLDLPLHRHEDLDHLHHAWRQLVTALQLVDLVHEAALEALLGLFVLLLDGLDLGLSLLVLEPDLPPLAARDVGQGRLVDFSAFAGTLRTLGDFLAEQRVLQAAVDVAIEDLQLVIAVLGQALDLLALDRHGALVLLDAVPVEHAHLDHRAGHARRQPERGVAHVGGLLAEDGAKQLLLRRHRALALRRDLANEDVAGIHFGPDV